MFKTLAGAANQPLQDLITAEKVVLTSLQKLSDDYSKASEALRAWGLSEGQDLEARKDIIDVSTTLLNHFSAALSRHASYGHTMRDQLKAIRTRGEEFEDLKQRRRTLARKADDTERKLSKLGIENKNRPAQIDSLSSLHTEIGTTDSDIVVKEAALYDFKRTATRMWMGFKFGGLLEMCEKGTVVAEYGKLTTAEISEEISQPGVPRGRYTGHQRTKKYIEEAESCIAEVARSTVPSVGFRDRRHYKQRYQEASIQPATDIYVTTSEQSSPGDSTRKHKPPTGKNEG